MWAYCLDVSATICLFIQECGILIHVLYYGILMNFRVIILIMEHPFYGQFVVEFHVDA